MKIFSQNVLLYGAGGHAKVIIDCLASADIGIKAIFDDNSKLKELSLAPVIACYDKDKYSNLAIIISVGNNSIRKLLSEKIKHQFAKAIHSSTLVSPSAVLSLGTVLMHGAIIQASTHVGEHCIINTGASVDHDCCLANFVHISPHATLCGNVSVGEGSHIGAGATIIEGVNIGKWATVGAGATIINDVPDYGVVVGTPGKIIKYNKK